MKEIPLTKGLVAIVDDDDYERVCVFSWYAMPRKYTAYAARSGPRDEQGHREYIPMHRFILGIRPEDGGVVDHINRNGLDNRRSNLRVTNKSGNALNSPRARKPKRCKECGKEFMPSHSKGKFCDSSCFGRWNMRNRNQRKLGWR